MPKLNYESEKFESYEDAAAALFMDLYAQSIRLPDAEALQSENSAQFQNRCSKLFRKYQNHQNGRKLIKGTGRFLKGVAVLVIAALSLGSALFMTVEAVREPILDFYIQHNDGNWQLSSNRFGPDSNDPNHSMPRGFNEKDPLGALLPDDFHLDSIEGNLTESLMAIYCDDDQKVISFSSVCSDSISHINTENADVERLRIGEYDAVLSIRKDDNSAVLVWYNSDLEIVLTLKTDTFSKDELIRIAQIVNQQLMH